MVLAPPFPASAGALSYENKLGGQAIGAGVVRVDPSKQVLGPGWLARPADQLCQSAEQPGSSGWGDGGCVRAEVEWREDPPFSRGDRLLGEQPAHRTRSLCYWCRVGLMSDQ